MTISRMLRSGCCAFIAALCILAAPAAARADWLQFRGDDSNNAVVPGSMTATWHVDTGGPISASPTYSNGTVYVGNNYGRLYAIDAATGHVNWTYRVSSPLMSAPLLYRGLVIVGEGDADSIGPGPNQRLRVGMGANALFALDAKTGRLRWRLKLTGSGMPTPAIINGLLVDHNGSGWIMAVDPMRGTKVYERDLNSVASMTAALPVGNAQYITAGVLDNAVWLLSARDGATVWRTNLMANASGMGDCPPVTDGRYVFCNYVAPIGSDQYTVIGNTVEQRAYALDVKTGARLWDVSLERGVLPPRNESAIPLLAYGTLYFGSAISPWFHAIDARTGRVKWRIQTHGPVKNGPATVNGAIYFGDGVGFLWAVDAASGRVIGEKAMPSGYNVGSGLIVGKTLIIGNDYGSVDAVPLQSIRSGRDR